MSEVCNRGDALDADFLQKRISQMVADQKQYFLTGATLPLQTRRAALSAILSGLEEHEDQFLEALESDLGKPRIEAWLSEIFFLKTELRLTIKRLKRWMKPESAGHPLFLLPSVSSIHRDPFGTALVISPWNYPLQLALAPAISAIAGGNTVVIKPSESTPATSRVLAELIQQSCPPELATVIEGDASTASALLEQDFDFFFFTGGEKVGRIVAHAAAEKLAPCVLELGGKCPAVIDWSTDIPKAVERIASGKFFNAGQTCLAPDFVAVPDILLDEFLSELGSFLELAYGGKQMEIAHCINEKHRERVLSLVPDHASQVGNDGPEPLKLAPRWAVVDWGDPCMKEEIFGPFLPIISYPERSSFIDKLAQLPSPLALYLFSDSRDFCNEVMKHLPSGSVCINDVMKQALNLELPFGGVGPSGHGRYRGRAGFNTFTYQRPVSRRFMIKDLFAIRPPYGGMLRKMRKCLK